VRTLALSVVCFTMLVGASAAFADSSTILSGYGSTGSNAVVEVKGAQAAPPTAVAASTGTLPFTGSELAVVAGGAIVLLGMGLVLRRIGRDNL
jgi:hypothetical protein